MPTSTPTACAGCASAPRSGYSRRRSAIRRRCADSMRSSPIASGRDSRATARPTSRRSHHCADRRPCVPHRPRGSRAAGHRRGEGGRGVQHRRRRARHRPRHCVDARNSAADAAVRAGAWPATLGHELHGKTLGIVGFGHVGRHVAKIAARVRHARACRQSASYRRIGEIGRRRGACARRPAARRGRRFGARVAHGANARTDRCTPPRLDESRRPSSSTPRAGRSSTRRRWSKRSRSDGSQARRSTSSTPSRCRRDIH